MTSAHVDASEVEAFAAELTAKGQLDAQKVSTVVFKGARNIQAQLRSEMGASRSFGMLAGGITFDMDDDELGAEIGPVKRSGSRIGAGKGANIAYFGTSRGGGTVPDPQGALDAEEPRFIQALEDLIEDI